MFYLFHIKNFDFRMVMTNRRFDFMMVMSKRGCGLMLGKLIILLGVRTPGFDDFTVVLPSNQGASVVMATSLPW